MLVEMEFESKRTTVEMIKMLERIEALLMVARLWI